METGPQLRVSTDRLEEPGMELGNPGYKVRCPLHHGSSYFGLVGVLSLDPGLAS